MTRFGDSSGSIISGIDELGERDSAFVTRLYGREAARFWGVGGRIIDGGSS